MFSRTFLRSLLPSTSVWTWERNAFSRLPYLTVAQMRYLGKWIF